MSSSATASAAACFDFVGDCVPAPSGFALPWLRSSGPSSPAASASRRATAVSSALRRRRSTAFVVGSRAAPQRWHGRSRRHRKQMTCLQPTVVQWSNHSGGGAASGESMQKLQNASPHSGHPTETPGSLQEKQSYTLRCLPPTLGFGRLSSSRSSWSSPSSPSSMSSPSLSARDPGVERSTSSGPPSFAFAALWRSYAFRMRRARSSRLRIFPSENSLSKASSPARNGDVSLNTTKQALYASLAPGGRCCSRSPGPSVAPTSASTRVSGALRSSPFGSFADTRTQSFLRSFSPSASSTSLSSYVAAPLRQSISSTKRLHFSNVSLSKMEAGQSSLSEPLSPVLSSSVGVSPACESSWSSSRLHLE
mmetsp:Transcript_11561/g.40221  ORF Transcript_11561/g.40221 Transcript_11561/m.40221 type:complete len:365 (-) Transcript_11561:167-1261(-)